MILESQKNQLERSKSAYFESSKEFCELLIVLNRISLYFCKFPYLLEKLSNEEIIYNFKRIYDNYLIIDVYNNSNFSFHRKPKII